ncbi:hypothetical protein [Thermococcus sp.]
MRDAVRLYIVVLLVVSILGAMPWSGPGSVKAVTYDINSCGVVINEPGYYEITQDLISNGQVCIHINSSNVYLNGKGHLLQGNRAGTAIAVYNYNTILRNITVTNLTITNFSAGVNFTGVNGGEDFLLELVGNTL